MTMLMVGGGFDLSVGATAALAGVLTIRIAEGSLLGAIAVPVLAGSLARAANGFLVMRLSINRLIVTLGTRYVLYAAASLATAGLIQVNHNREFAALEGNFAVCPFPVLFSRHLPQS